jgi:DNA-binding HxlR family transcriptional regulator
MCGDEKQTILSVLKELSKNNKFMHKNDIHNLLQNKISKQALDAVLNQLCEDGVIYSTYDNDIYSVTEMN